jgi:50S ribosomal protein L16 3-hydroxylase
MVVSVVTPGLDALIHPRSRAELLASFRDGEPFVVHGAHEAMAELAALPLLTSLDTLLQSWPYQVQVHLPEVADEASSISATPQDARKLFATGMGLLFDEIHTISPVLARWLEALRKDLGLSALTQGRCMVYATRDGRGTATHFDQNVNFVLQLHGTKTWWLAPNTHVTDPLTRYTIGQPIDPELHSYAHDAMPAAMPEDRRSIVLAPGSMLFVPRGFWHSTEAAGDALSLNFTYSAPSWIDLVTAALRGRLAQSPAWRATALPASSDQLKALLRELAEDVPHWAASDILAVTESPDEE